MSQQFNIKLKIIALMNEPANKDRAVDLLLEAVDMTEEDFEYENSESASDYLFGK